MRILARHYATGEPSEILCRQGKIVALRPCLPSGAGESRPSVEEPATVELVAGWVAPALFDLQINGALGWSFNSDHLTIEGMHAVVGLCRQHGIGSFCPTLVTGARAALTNSLSTLRAACETDPKMSAAMPVFHLEGPYISAADGPRGAHPRQHVRPPDWEEFCLLQEAAGGRIRLVTLAPEYEGALDFIEKLSAAGVVPALGHTAAAGTRIRDAVRAGARLSTHLGNGAHALLPRHDNYLWEQLAADELWASIICDGHHLPAALVRVILRVKTPARTILTCDASSLAGLPPGRYREWDQELEVLPEGKISLAGTPYLAGSGSFTDHCVGNVMRFAGVCLREAVDMAGARPRALLGLPARRLEVGEPADLVLFDWEEGGAFLVRKVLIAPG